MTRAGVRSLAVFQKHYLSFATCFCKEMVPSRERLLAIYAIILPKFTTQSISIGLMAMFTEIVLVNIFLNCNLSVKFVKIFSCINLPLYGILFAANTVVAISFWHLCVISIFCMLTHSVTSLPDSFT